MRRGRALARGLGMAVLLAAVMAPGGLLARWPGRPMPLLLAFLTGRALAGALQEVVGRGPGWAWGLARLVLSALAGWGFVQEAPAFLGALASALPEAIARPVARGAEWAGALRSAWGGPALAGAVLWVGGRGLLSLAPPEVRPWLAPIRAGGGALLAWGLLSSSGVLAGVLGRDLAFLLPAGLLGLAGLPLVMGLPPGLGRRLPYVAPLLAGLLRFSALALLLAPLPRVLEALAGPHLPPLLNSVLARWSPLHGVALALLLSLSGALRGLERGGWARPALSVLEAAGLGGAGLLAWALLAGMADLWSPLPRLGETLLGGFLAGALGRVLSLLVGAPHPALRALGGWAEASVLRNLALGSALTAYLRFARGPLYAATPYAPALEWGLVGVLALRLLLGVRSALGQALAEGPAEPEPPVWTRHRQVAAVRSDPGLEWTRTAIVRFVEGGDPAGLVVALTDALRALGWPPERVAEALRPLLNYRDRPEPWPAFPWERRRVRQANLAARAGLVAQYTALLEQGAARKEAHP